jgi:hypothetical protein
MSNDIGVKSSGGTLLAMAEKVELVVPGLQDQLAGAWQLAYVLTDDADAASEASMQAFVDVASDPPEEGHFRIPLLRAVMRIAWADDSPIEPGEEGRLPEVAANFWHLSGKQRAALWLTQEGMEVGELATVLDISSKEAGVLVDEALDWLEASIDQVSGPLCPFEPSVPAYLHGDLAPEQAMEMDDHVPSCPTCRHRIEAVEGLAELGPVFDSAVPTPPAGLALRAFDRWEEQLAESAAETESRRFADWRSLRPLAACCGGLLLLGVIGLGVVRPVASATTKGSGPLAPAVSTTVAPVTVPAIIPAPATTSTTLAPPVTFPTGH